MTLPVLSNAAEFHCWKAIQTNGQSIFNNASNAVFENTCNMALMQPKERIE
jgi:hypothetical protein